MRIALTLVLSLLIDTGYAQNSVPPAELHAGSSNKEIADHLYWHELHQTQTGALAEHFPDLSRERAYAIQRGRLLEHSRSDKHVGWKLGWTRYTGPDEPLDPIVGHYMSKRVYAEGDPVSTRFFTAGTASAEPEIVFYLGSDLPGPVVTREEVLAAIDSVGIAMEFVNFRVLTPATREHAIADNGIAAGVVLSDRMHPVEELDFSKIEGRVTVNDGETSHGLATSIMDEDPIAGLLWAANEVPKWGMHLKAGDFVVSGTVCIPLPVSAGDSAEVEFTGLGYLRATFVP